MDGTARAIERVNTAEETQGQTAVENNLHIACWYVSRIAAVLIVFACSCIGSAYVLAQWLNNKSVLDTFFIGILLGATAFLMRALQIIHRFILQRGIDFFAFVAAQPRQQAELEKYPELISSVFHSKRMTWIGILYGLALGSTPYVLGVWPQNHLLRLLLALFMFSINFVTGVGFYGLITFFVKSLKLGQLIRVDLWQKENPSTEFLLGAARQVCLRVSAYICLCNASVLFSVLPLSGFVLGYAMFSGSLIILSLIIPAVPIVQKIAATKRDALHQVNTQLQGEFSQILEGCRSQGGQLDLTRLERLMALRDKIESTTVLPFRVRFFGTGISVVLISLLPAVLQFLLEKYWK